MTDSMKSHEEQKKQDAQNLKEKQDSAVRPSGNQIVTPSPISGQAVPAANLPSMDEADAIVEKQHKQALAAKEKSDKEAQARKEKDDKARQEEEERRSKIQRMLDGEAGSVSASKTVKRYETEDGLPPRYEAGRLEPINAKKPKPTTPTTPNT